jgi:hypothetical protein
MKNMKRNNSKKKNNGTPSKRKFLGFNFYIQCNEKLSRKNRIELINKSTNYLNIIFNSIYLSSEEKITKGITNELDDNLTDYELLEIWNPIYEKYGYLIPEFKDKWERKHLNGKPKSFKTSNVGKFETKINELEFRIKQLELHIHKRKYVEGMG